MVTILSGVGLLLVTLAVFSIFSLKMPKGSLAMGGMADAAVATFLVEAIHKYISGDLIGIAFLREVGDISGSMGGVAAATLVPIAMGANPLFAVVAGVAVGGSESFLDLSQVMSSDSSLRLLKRNFLLELTLLQEHL